VRADSIVVLSPVFDDDLCLLQAVEDFAIEQFVTELRVEALAIAIFPRTAGHDVGGFGTDRSDPFAERLGNEFRPIVGSNVLGDATQDKQIGQNVDHIRCLQLSADLDGNAFPCELIDHIEHAELPSVVGAILDEVIGPDMVGILRPKPDARTFIQPEPAALGLSVRNFEPLTPPYPFNPFDVHHPARTVQHRRDAAIAIAAILESERDDVGGQCRFVIRCLRDLALRGSMLTKNLACPSFGHAKFVDHMIHTGTAACGA